MKKKLATQGRRSLAFTIMLLMLLSTIALSPATASITVSAAGPTSGQNMDEYRVIAYVTQWSWPGTDDPMVDNDATTTVDPMRVTHINYAFGHIVQSQGTGTSYTNGNQNSAQFPGTVDVPDPDKLRALVALKAQNPKLKVLLSIGGWGMDGFCPIVHDATKRAAFVNSCLEICKTYGLDGIDMDYEYPGTSADSYDRLSCSHDVNGSGVTESGQDSPPGAADGNDYVELMKAFRNNAEYGYNYLLTIASGIGYDWAVASATPQYPNYLDFINIMTYDIYGEWRNHSEFNANLYGSGSLSSDTEEGGGKVLSYDLTCNRIALRGYPRDIMNIGIPLYGRERYYRRSTAAPARNLNNVTPLPASLGDNSWMTFNQIMSLYDANASTESKVLKDVIGFTDIATDPNLNKTTVQIGKGGVVTTVGGYTRAQVAETELEFVSNTVHNTWVAASSATYGEGVLTVRIKSSPKAADVGKTIARTYSLTYDDVRDVVAKTEWIQEMGFGGGMYWEYSQDSTSRTEFDVKLPWEGLITETIYKGLNGPRSTVTQPARGSGGTSAVLQYGRKATPPVISYRYDKSLNATTNKYKEWDSRENMQSQLGTVAADADAGIATAYNNNKVRFFEGGLYVNASTPYHIYYGVLPVLAPAYATSGTYTPQSNSTLVRGNGYAWMQSRNSSYVANASAVGVSTPEWTFLKDFPSTRINRTEFNTPLRAPSNAALHVISANPSAKQVLPGTTVNYNIEVLGGSGNYTSVTHQVWFLGVKYDNNDGYRKTEKRRTGGPYPIPTGAGAGAQNSPAGGTGVDFKNEPGTALGLDRKVITSTVGETRATIVPSKTSGTGVVSFSTNEYGTYYIFTQVTDSTGKLAAQFSQPVEVTDVLDLDLQVTSTTNAGTGVNVNTVVTATGAATGAAAVGMEYKFEVFNGTTSVFTRDYAAGTTFNFTPTTEGTYKVKVTGKNSSGDEVSAISTSFLVTQPLTITSVTPTTANVGTSKLFTAVAIGGVGAKTYSYYVLKGGKVWASQAYTSNTTFNWTPTEAGTYRLRVYCQDEAVTRVVKEITVTVS